MNLSFNWFKKMEKFVKIKPHIAKIVFFCILILILAAVAYFGVKIYFSFKHNFFSKQLVPDNTQKEFLQTTITGFIVSINNDIMIVKDISADSQAKDWKIILEQGTIYQQNDSKNGNSLINSVLQDFQKGDLVVVWTGDSKNSNKIIADSVARISH